MTRASISLAAILFAAVTRSLAQTNSNSSPGDVLLLDSLGRVVKVSTNEVPAGLLPPPQVGVKGQRPEPLEGSSQPEEIQERHREASHGFRFLPSVPPPLSPYLASQNQFGNTAARPGSLFGFYPMEPYVQGPKYWLSQFGLDYSLIQTLSFVNMTGVSSGHNVLSYYTFELKSAWAIYDSPATGSAGWIRSQLDTKTGIGANGHNEDARRNLGTITDPTGLWSSINGVRMPELAWGQSLLSGEVVLLAGMVNQGNYIDQNAYAQSGRGQFINSALISSEVLPLPQYNFGLNLQWQPAHEWYAMMGASAGNNNAGSPPWTDFNLDTWTLLWELAYAPQDVFGLGPGVYRVDPFLANVEGTTGAGVSFNLQQKLGPTSPFGWFGRFGFGNDQVSARASTQVATGFVVQGPFQHYLLRRVSTDLLGIGFVWSQPSAARRIVYHQNEYVFEAFYAEQLTPTIRLQPDFQYIVNPAFNPTHNEAFVFQLQLVLSW